MEAAEPLKRFWQENKKSGTNASEIDRASVDRLIQARIRRERSKIAKYFWATLTYHIIIYSFMSYLFVRYMGDVEIMVASLAGAVLFIPFTVILLRRFKAIFKNAKAGTPDAVYQHVANQHELLQDFFKLKKRFDLFIVPASNLLAALILLRLYVPGGIAAHWQDAITPFLIAVGCCALAIHQENRKQFIAPLKQLRAVLDDMQEQSAQVPLT